MPETTARIHHRDTAVRDDKPRAWYFTFGTDHVHPLTAEPLGRSYVRITGTWKGSRAVMASRFGNRWAFQYESAALAGVEQYGLHEIPLPATPLYGEVGEWIGPGGGPAGTRCPACGQPLNYGPRPDQVAAAALTPDAAALPDGGPS